MKKKCIKKCYHSYAIILTHFKLFLFIDIESTTASEVVSVPNASVSTQFASISVSIRPTSKQGTEKNTHTAAGTR